MEAHGRKKIIAASFALVVTAFAFGAAPAKAADDTALTARAQALQARIYGKAPADQSLAQRLKGLEEYLIGSEQSGESAIRLGNLKAILDGTAGNHRAVATYVKNDNLPPVNSHPFDVSQVSDPVDAPANTLAGNSSVFIPDAVPPEVADSAPQPLPKRSAQSEAGLENARIARLEKRVYGHPSGKSAEGSLADMELFALGQPQGGTMKARIDRLESVLNAAAPSITGTD